MSIAANMLETILVVVVIPTFLFSFYVWGIILFLRNRRRHRKPYSRPGFRDHYRNLN